MFAQIEYRTINVQQDRLYLIISSQTLSNSFKPKTPSNKCKPPINVHVWSVPPTNFRSNYLDVNLLLAKCSTRKIIVNLAYISLKPLKTVHRRGYFMGFYCGLKISIQISRVFFFFCFFPLYHFHRLFILLN